MPTTSGNRVGNLGYKYMAPQQEIPEYLPIDNVPHLERHTKSMGLVNTDKEEKKKYRISRDRILQEKKLLSDAVREINILKSELAGLKQIVMKYMPA